MADQGKWFKLWCSSLDDQDLENLSIHEWFGWARFGTYIKRHGKGGKIRLREPATAVVNVMRVATFKDAINMIKKFPNYHVEETKKDPSTVTANVTVEHRYTVSVKCRNWQKYQGDFSAERVKSYRVKNRQVVTANVTAQEEKRSRREEKRREESVLGTSPPAEAAPYQMPDPKTDPKRCLVLSYKSRMGVAYDNRDWDKTNFARAMVAAGSLLSLCKDFQSAEACLNDLSGEYDRKELSWTLETVARHAADWLKKTGRTNADTSRAGLRMAIARRKAEGEGQGGLVKAADGPLPHALRDGPDRGGGNEKDSDQ